jgi:hypothetical protein
VCNHKNRGGGGDVTIKTEVEEVCNHKNRGGGGDVTIKTGVEEVM